VAEERAAASGPGILGGGAARLAAHAAALRARTALVAKVGADEPGRRVRDALERLKVDLRWLRETPGLRTTIWHQPDGEAQGRRVERGADLGLRLDELPPNFVRAALTVVSGYALSVEPARSAALGALAGSIGGRPAGVGRRGAIATRARRRSGSRWRSGRRPGKPPLIPSATPNRFGEPVRPASRRVRDPRRQRAGRSCPDCNVPMAP